MDNTRDVTRILGIQDDANVILQECRTGVRTRAVGAIGKGVRHPFSDSFEQVVVKLYKWGDARLFSAYLYLTERWECLNLYAPYEQIDGAGNNILHYLAIEGANDIAVIRTSQNGCRGISSQALCDVNNDGQTPIHVAIWANAWETLEAFIALEPDLNRSEFDDIAELLVNAEPPYEILKALKNIGLRTNIFAD